MTIVAIDPGKNGALVRMEGGIVTEVTVMPLAGGDFDVEGISDVLREWRPEIVVCEATHAFPRNGSVGNFVSGECRGIIRGVCAARGLRLEFVTPQRWKGKVLDGTPKDKDAAIAYCRRAFPSVSLLDHGKPKSQKAHDGIADGVCIADYARRTYAAA